MSHEIAMVNGKASIAYVGETPWHGLGQALTPGASLDVWAEQAGMNYKVNRSRVRFGEGAAQRLYDDKHVLFRSDSKQPLAVVSNRYAVVQPSEVLGFFKNLCAEHGFALETAGVLYGGARYWAMAKMPMDFTLPGNDKVGAYCTLATSVDGSMATTGLINSIRVVCNNTLRLSLGTGSKQAVKVRHSSKFSQTKMQIEMGLIQGAWGEFAETAQAMAKKRISRKDAVGILIQAFGDPAKPVEDQPNARPMAEIMKLFDGAAIGAELEASRGTLWGLVNAATEWSDHHAGRQSDSRLASAWFGQNADRKATVYEAGKAVLVMEKPERAAPGWSWEDRLGLR